MGQSTQDVGAAVEELQASLRLPAVCLIGLRLGASLAALAACGRSDVEALVLWEPVTDGREYVEELLGAHRNWLDRRAEALGRRAQREVRGEVLGFPFTDALRGSIESIDLLGLRRVPAPDILVIERAETPGAARLRDHLASLGAHIDHRTVPEPEVWRSRPRDQAVVPVRTLESIVGWVRLARRSARDERVSSPLR